jgi:hypothetical protein
MENKSFNEFKNPDCMCKMCSLNRGDHPPLITCFHAPSSNNNRNTLQTIQQNHLLSQDLNVLKKNLVKYTNDNKINLSTKQIEIFISKFFEELHKKYIITLRSKL